MCFMGFGGLIGLDVRLAAKPDLPTPFERFLERDTNVRNPISVRTHTRTQHERKQEPCLF